MFVSSESLRMKKSKCLSCPVSLIDAKIERREELKEGETMLCTELYEGTVARTFTLLSDIDDTKAEARYENGMLELRLPKKAGARSKALPVS